MLDEQDQNNADSLADEQDINDINVEQNEDYDMDDGTKESCGSEEKTNEDGICLGNQTDMSQKEENQEHLESKIQNSEKQDILELDNSICLVEEVGGILNDTHQEENNVDNGDEVDNKAEDNYSNEENVTEDKIHVLHVQDDSKLSVGPGEKKTEDLIDNDKL